MLIDKLLENFSMKGLKLELGKYAVNVCNCVCVIILWYKYS